MNIKMNTLPNQRQSIFLINIIVIATLSIGFLIWSAIYTNWYPAVSAFFSASGIFSFLLYFKKIFPKKQGNTIRSFLYNKVLTNDKLWLWLLMVIIIFFIIISGVASIYITLDANAGVASYEIEPLEVDFSTPVNIVSSMELNRGMGILHSEKTKRHLIWTGLFSSRKFRMEVNAKFPAIFPVKGLHRQNIIVNNNSIEVVGRELEYMMVLPHPQITANLKSEKDDKQILGTLSITIVRDDVEIENFYLKKYNGTAFWIGGASEIDSVERELRSHLLGFDRDFVDKHINPSFSILEGFEIMAGDKITVTIHELATEFKYLKQTEFNQIKGQQNMEFILIGF